VDDCTVTRRGDSLPGVNPKASLFLIIGLLALGGLGLALGSLGSHTTGRATATTGGARGDAVGFPPSPDVQAQAEQRAASERKRRQADATLQASVAARRAAQQQRGIDFSYTDLLEALDQRQIAEADINAEAGTVDVELTDGSKHTTGFPPSSGAALSARLAQAGSIVVFDSHDDGAHAGPVFARVAIGVGLILLLVLVLTRFARPQPGKGGSRADSHGRLRGRQQGDTGTRFTDVAGAGDAVAELKEAVDFLRDPARYRSLGAELPHGVILHGPPGTGKTLLARAVAGEAGLPFFAVSGSDFVELYVGTGAARVRDLFAQARAAETGAVIYIDEIDAVGRRRSGGGNGDREGDQTLNQLLVELDGFNRAGRIAVIASTNRLDTLDPALLRPGRFTRHIHVGLPDEQGRYAILQVHARSKPLADDVDLGNLAVCTAGSSGADLANMLNEAAIVAARTGARVISQEHLREGFLRAVAGPRKPDATRSAEDRRAVAYHEAGHALCAELCPTVDPTLHVTINPRGQAAGFAVVGRSDRTVQTEQEIHEQLVFMLGGRAAEQLVFGAVSSGAAGDLRQANALARRAVEEYGLSARVGQLIRSHEGLSDRSAHLVEREIARIVDDGYRAALALVTQHHEELDRLAGVLIEHGDVDRGQIEEALAGVATVPQRPNLRALPDPDASPATTRARVRRRSRHALAGRIAAAALAFRRPESNVPDRA
jgi:cell division protease FtsH